jgi:hypothetical protein
MVDCFEYGTKEEVREIAGAAQIKDLPAIAAASVHVMTRNKILSLPSLLGKPIVEVTSSLMR